MQDCQTKKLRRAEEDNRNSTRYMDDNMPSWAKPTIQKLMDEGVLVGDEEGRLGLTMDALRILVVLDRIGLFD